MKIKKLLFVTKFELLGFDALQSLLNIRDVGLNHIVFLNVIERERVAMRRGTGYQKDEEIRLRERANIRFIDWAENLFEQGMEVGVYIVVGNLVSEVIKAVNKEDADLIVIGRSHKGVLEQLYSGSDVTELLRRAAIPVLVYKYTSENALAIEQPFVKPLLAADWSPASAKAAEYLKTLKGVAQKIDVVHVASEKELKGTSSLDVQKTRKKIRRRLNGLCDIFEAEGITARSHVYIGDPADEIDRVARDCQSTMVVLGSSSKSSWVERWIGSVPRKIAENSVLPTLIIPPPKT